MANIEKMISGMTTEELSDLSGILADEAKARAEMEKRAQATRDKIQDILDESGFKLRDLYGKSSGPRMRDFPDDRHINHRIPGTPRFKLNGITYDGRQARRVSEFEEFVRDGRIDVDLVVRKGALNPVWLDEQPERILVSLGISNLEAYKAKHDL